MIKFNYVFLLIALIAFSKNIFCMDAPPGPGDSTFVIVPGNDQTNPPLVGDTNRPGNHDDNPRDPSGDSDDEDGEDVDPADQAATFFTKGRVALAALLGCSAFYLVYKYFADSNDQEQDVNEILD